ncbi:MAG: RNA methyltransferase [Anaerolineales bacterium]|nr:RNA methyltransferase [Anaerolineales bacterium]
MITAASNARIKFVRNLQARRSAREAERLFVVEGVRLSEEAAKAGARARLVLHTPDLDERGRVVAARLAELGAPVEAVTPAVMAAASDTRAPAGLLAVVPWSDLPLPTPLTLALVLDGLGDPGNVGTALRVAGAAGAQAVFLMPGTVDAYNPKVVRAAMGAHFYLPIVPADWETLPKALAGLDLWLAEAGAGQPYTGVDWRRPAALIVGSEAAGPGAAARALAPGRVTIPMPGRAESLNAAMAAAVLLFEAARQRGTQL